MILLLKSWIFWTEIQISPLIARYYYGYYSAVLFWAIPGILVGLMWKVVWARMRLTEFLSAAYFASASILSNAVLCQGQLRQKRDFSARLYYHTGLIYLLRVFGA